MRYSLNLIFWYKCNYPVVYLFAFYIHLPKSEGHFSLLFYSSPHIQLIARCNSNPVYLQELKKKILIIFINIILTKTFTIWLLQNIQTHHCAISHSCMILLWSSCDPLNLPLNLPFFLFLYITIHSLEKVTSISIC